MARVIAQRELRNQNAQVLDSVEAGTSFVVTRNGVPVAELRPIGRARRRLVPRSDLVAVVAAGPRIDAASFRRDIDRVIDSSLPSPA